jgi:hypothetical protein
MQEVEIKIFIQLIFLNCLLITVDTEQIVASAFDIWRTKRNKRDKKTNLLKKNQQILKKLKKIKTVVSDSEFRAKNQHNHEQLNYHQQNRLQFLQRQLTNY